MAKIQHLYQGHGDPNLNPALSLTGDQVGNHLYQDLDNSQAVWISCTYEDEGQIFHDEWHRLVLAINLSLAQIGVNQPRWEGDFGYAGDGRVFIGMRNPGLNYELGWRFTGMTLGDWYEVQE